MLLPAISGLLAMVSALQAQTLRVDPFFAPELRVNGGNILAAAAQTDGKIVVAGDFSWINGTAQPYLARLNADGSLDSSFTPQVSGGPVYAIAIQSDGNIVIGGAFTQVGGTARRALARLTSTGAVDGSFSSTAGVSGLIATLAIDANGAIFAGGTFAQTLSGTAHAYVTKFDRTGADSPDFLPNLAIGSYDYATTPVVAALLLLPDGRVMVAGHFLTVSGVTTGGLALLTTTGGLDPAWTTRASSVSATALARDGAGTLYAAVVAPSYAGTAWPYGRTMIRLSAALAPDVTWNPGPFYGQINSLFPLSSGALLVGGTRTTLDPTTITGPLVRYLADGTLDTSYRPGLLSKAVNAITAANGQIVVAGYAGGLGQQSAVSTLAADGTVTKSYAPQLQSPGVATAVVVQTDGKIIVGGTFDAIGNQSASGLVRLTPEGRVDASFVAPAGAGGVSALLLQPDGRVLVRSANGVPPGGSGSSAVSRLNTDGSPDPTYNPTLPTYLGTTAWAVQGDGKLLVANGSSIDRYSMTGALDATFPLPNYNYGAAFLIQPDGRLVVSGTFTTAGPAGRAQSYLERLNADGTFDGTFTSPLQGLTSYYYSTPPVSPIALAPDGSLYIAGTMLFADNSQPKFARLTSNGLRDTSYTTSIGPSDTVSRLVVRPDGTVLAAGSVGGSYCLRLLQASGGFDPSVNFPATTVDQLVADGAGGAIVAGQFSTFGGLVRHGLVRVTPQTAFAQLPAAASTAAGQTLTVAPQLAGSSSATYQWRRNGSPVTGATSSTLTLANFDPSTQSGNYTLVVTDAGLSFETDPIVVAGTTASAIATQPSSLLEDLGGTAVFTVAATGIPSPTYQWAKNGAAISGATSTSLVLPNLQSSDAATYTVTVSNSAGSVTSSGAVLSLRTTALDRQFAPKLYRNSGATLQAISALSDGRFIVSGSFQALNGVAVSSLVAVQANGQNTTGFAPVEADSPALYLSDGTVLVWGPNHYNGTNWVNTLKRMDGTGQLIAGFALDVSGSNGIRVLPAGTAVILTSSGGISVGGVVSANGIARVRLDGTLDTSFAIAPVASGATPTVLGTTSDGKVYLHYLEYSFTSGTYTRRILRALSTGAVDSSFTVRTLTDSNGYSSPTAIVQSDDRLVLGLPTSATDAGTRGLLRLNLDGSTDAAFQTALPAAAPDGGLLSPVAAFPDGRLLVRQGSNTWWRLLATGARDGTFAIPNVSTFSGAAALSDGSVLAWVTGYGSASVSLTHYDSSGRAMTSGIPQLGVTATVRRVAQQGGGRMYVLGDYDWVNGVAQHALARLERNGQIDASFVPQLKSDESVTALAVQSDGRLLIGGSLRRFAGDTVAPRLLRLQADGSIDPQFILACDADIRDLAIQSNGVVIVAGNFSTIAGAPESRIARILPSGGVDLGFTAPYQKYGIGAVAIQPNGLIVVAADSTSPSYYSAATTLRRLASDGSYDATWPTAALNGAVYSMSTDSSGNVVVAGSYSAVGGTGRWGIARFTSSGTLDPTFAPVPSSFYYGSAAGTIVSVLAEPDTGKVLLGGAFAAINDTSRFALARVRADGGLDDSLWPRITASGSTTPVDTLSRSRAGDIVAGGAFTAVDGLSVTGLARWTTRSFAITFPSPIQTVNTGASTTLTATVQGSGAFTYQWQKNGANISGATASSLTLSNVDATAGGTYQVVVTNGQDTHVSDPISLVVSQAPAISQQPQDVSAVIGGVAELSVVATAVPAPTYQWQKNGTAIPGATNASFLLPSVQPTDAGSYSVVVTNSLGSVTSASAALTVAGARLDQGYAPAFLTGYAGTSSYDRPQITAALKLADGRWLIGGTFRGVNGLAMPYLARLLANGVPDATYTAPTALGSPVNTLTRLSSGKIMAGCGSGSAGSGPSAVAAIRLLTDGSLDTGFAPFQVQGRVSAFAERSDGAIYAGGDFVVGTSYALVRLSGDGSIDPTFAPGLDSNVIVDSVAVFGDGVAVGEEYRYSSSTTLLRFAADGTADPAWNVSVAPPPSSYWTPRITSLLVTGSGQLLAAGTFGKMGTATVAGLARFNADGSFDSSFVPAVSVSLNATPRLFAVSGGKFVIDGAVTVHGPQNSMGAARLNADGSLDRAYSLGTTDKAMLLDVASDGTALATPTSMSGSYYSSVWSVLLPLDATSAIVGNIQLDLDSGGTVSCLATMANGSTMVAGSFNLAGGQNVVRVARLLPGGRVDPAFKPAVLGSDTYVPAVNAIVVQSDGRVILGGQFTSFNGSIRNDLVRLNADGTIDGAYNPAANGIVDVLALDGSGRLLVGGEFSTIGGGTAPKVARLGVDGALDSSFVPDVPTGWARVTALAVTADGHVLVSGGGAPYSSSSSAGLVRLLATGVRDATFDATNLFATSLGILPDQRVVATIGDSSTYWQANQLLLFETDGTRTTGFSPTLLANPTLQNPQGISFGLTNLAVQSDGKIVVAGGFTVVNGYPRAGLVRLGADGTVDPLLNPGTGIAGSGSPLALGVQADGSIVLGGNFSAFNGMPAAGMARFVNRTFFVRVRQSNVLAAPGSGATLAVEAIGDGPFTYVWKRNGAVQTGATSASLVLTNVASAQAGDYVCEVTAGAQTVVSDPITFVVGTPPSITTQPQSVQLSSSAPVTLTVAAAGDPTLAYQWFRYNQAIAGATSATLTLPTGSDETGLFYVVATNSLGSAQSNVASVLVGSAPTLYYQPSNATVTVGNSLNLYLSVNGVPSPFVQWYHGGVAVPGLTGASASIANVALSDAGTYYATATNQFGSVTSNNMTVTVNPASPAAPFITGQPTAVSTTAGQSFTLSVSASGNPSPTYQWRFNGAPIAGATGASYSRYSAAPSDSGTYDVVVMNSQGTVTSNAVAVVVQQSPRFSDSASTIQALAGSTVVLSRAVTAAPAATYQWQKSGTAVSGATSSTLTLTNVQDSDSAQYTLTATNSVGSATSSPITLTVATVVQRGLASGSARLTGDYSGITTTFTIEGTAPKQMLLRAIGPTLAALGVTGVMTDPMIYVSDASGSYVASNNDWGQAVNAADVVATTARVGALALGTSSKDAALLVTLAPGTYTMTVLPANGVAGVALVEVYEADTTPRLVELSLRAHAGGGAAALTCGFNVTGSVSRPYLVRALGPALGKPSALPDPQLTLTKSGALVASNDDWSSDSTVAAQLSAAAARLGAAPLANGSKDAAMLVTIAPGTYIAQVTASDTSVGDVVLEILEADSLRSSAIAPAFVLMPQSQDVPQGGIAVLASLATGAPAPTYQWQKDGQPITGATSATYTLSNLQVAQAGTYTVVALNSSGTTESLPAVIGIGTGLPPSATQTVSGGGFVPGGTVTISNTLVYSGTATSLAWSATLPVGWSYVGGTNEGDVKPVVGSTGTLGWSWTTPPSSPVTFTYQVSVPSTETAIETIAATATIRTTTNSLRTIAANPDPLRIVPASMLHSADTNGDAKISLLELTRVIELYNTRNGTTRTGCYTTQSGTEDGFAPDASRSTSALVTLTAYHSADENRDGKISLLELTRVIELYNYRSGTTRTGQYHPQAGTEDGFATGP